MTQAHIRPFLLLTMATSRLVGELTERRASKKKAEVSERMEDGVWDSSSGQKPDIQQETGHTVRYCASGEILGIR